MRHFLDSSNGRDKSAANLHQNLTIFEILSDKAPRLYHATPPKIFSAFTRFS
jgi:hypothetical protein